MPEEYHQQFTCPSCGQPAELGHTDVCELAPAHQDQAEVAVAEPVDKTAGESDTSPEHMVLLTATAEQMNKSRSYKEKLLGKNKKTPEMLVQMEKDLMSTLMHRITSFNPANKEDGGYLFPSRLRSLIERVRGINTYGSSWYIFHDEYAPHSKADENLMDSILARPEVKDAVAAKMEEYFLAKPQIEHYRIPEVDQYLEISENTIRPQMADMLSKSDSYVTENFFQEKLSEGRYPQSQGIQTKNRKYYPFQNRPGFKEMFSDPELRKKIVSGSYEILYTYEKLLSESDVDIKKEDPFFLTPEDRNAFLVEWIRHHNGALSDQYAVYERAGLLDDPDTYRFFLKHAENTDKVIKVISDVQEKKNTHPAAQTLFDPAEWKEASPAMLHWLTRSVHPHHKSNDRLLQLTESQRRAAFDRYETIFTPVSDAKELTESNQYFTSNYNVGSTMSNAIKQFLALGTESENPEDRERTRLLAQHLYEVCDTELKQHDLGKDFFDKEVALPHELFNLMNIADDVSRMDPENREDFEQKISELISVGAGLIHVDRSILNSYHFRDKFRLLRHFGGYFDEQQKKKLGQLDQDTDQLFRFAEETSGAYSRASAGDKNIYWHVGEFENYDDVQRARKIMESFEYLGKKDDLISSALQVHKLHPEDFTNIQHVLDAIGDEQSRDIYAQLYFEMRGSLGHEESVEKVTEVIKKYSEIDKRLLTETWTEGPWLADEDHYQFVQQAYKRFGERALEYSRLFAEHIKSDPTLTADHAINFLTIADEHDFPITFAYEVQYRESKTWGNEEEWIARMKSMSDNMSHARTVNASEKGTPEHRILVEHTYPKSNYSRYDENRKLGDRNDDLKGFTFNKDGYPMVMSGVMGYERTQPRQVGALEAYQRRIDGIKNMASNQDAVFDAINKMRERASLPSFVEKGKDGVKEYGADVLALLMDQQDRKRNKIPLELTDQELADLAIAYHMRGWGNEFVQGTADQVAATESRDTQEYIQWDSLSRLFVEDGKQTLTNLYEQLKSDEEGQKILSALADRYRSSETIRVEYIAERLLTAQGALTETLSKIPEVSKHRGVVVKRVANDINNISQELIKGLSPQDKSQAQSALKEFIEHTIPSDGNYLESLNDPAVSQQLLSILQEYTFHPLQAVERILATDVNTIQREVGSYRAKTETDELETRLGKKKMVEKQQKVRNIVGYFSKSAEVANARATARICIATDTGMWDNQNYFEFVMFNEDTKTCEGTVMLLNMEEDDGKKYLLYCPNPSEHLLTQVSYEDCYRKLTPIIVNFSRENGYDGLVLSEMVEGASTNRTGGFASTLKNSKLKKPNGELEYAPVEKAHQLSGNYQYGGDKMKLNYIWKR